MSTKLMFWNLVLNPVISVYDSLREIAGQLKIDFQKLILRKVLIFMKIFENVFCYFRYSLNLVF